MAFDGSTRDDKGCFFDSFTTAELAVFSGLGASILRTVLVLEPRPIPKLDILEFGKFEDLKICDKFSEY